MNQHTIEVSVMTTIKKCLATACAAALSIGLSAGSGANDDFAAELARVESLTAVESDRAAIVAEILERVRPEAESRGFTGWETELSGLLNGVSSERLLNARSAFGYESVVAAATNFNQAAADFAGLASLSSENDIGGIAAIDGTTGLSFRAITPCRIVDTRNVFQPLLAGVARSFHVDNSAVAGVIAAQGGDCTQVAPADMAGIAATITVVRPAAGGFITLYPEGDVRPNASVINFIPGQILANSTVVKTPIASGADFQLYALSNVQVIVDLLGYFVPHDTLRVAASTTTSGVFAFDSPDCPAGYSYIGAEFSWGAGTSNVWMTGVARALPPGLNDPDLERARCRGNVEGAAQSIICYAVCQR
jgi:hypothetical protein